MSAFREFWMIFLQVSIDIRKDIRAVAQTFYYWYWIDYCRKLLYLCTFDFFKLRIKNKWSVHLWNKDYLFASANLRKFFQEFKLCMQNIRIISRNNALIPRHELTLISTVSDNHKLRSMFFRKKFILKQILTVKADISLLSKLTFRHT